MSEMQSDWQGNMTVIGHEWDAEWMTRKNDSDRTLDGVVLRSRKDIKSLVGEKLPFSVYFKGKKELGR